VQTRVPPYVDQKKLSKKYRLEIAPVIRAWKNGRSDQEISSAMGVDLWKLNQLRNDLQKAHTRYRLQAKKH